MRKIILLSLISIMLLLSTACNTGISKQDYDKVVDDLASAQTKINSLQNQLVSKENELTTAKDKLSQANTRIEILNLFMVPAFTGELQKMTQGQQANLFLEMRDKVNSTGDQLLKDKLQAVIDSGGNSDLVTSFFKYLLESISDMTK